MGAMAGPKQHSSDCDFSAGYEALRTHEPLPPYECDPIFDDPEIQRRIGRLIAQAAEAFFNRTH